MKTFKAFFYSELMESAYISDIKKIVSTGVDDSIEEMAKKLKAWAVENLQFAMKTGGFC